ncbi:glycerol-3-phosphate 1-O-acyltransferase PlsY [Staphylospora marina]|uniref:glycerol-3-phosphate 1-O-acyltransferase PlsY n=1 Tax=Staphylospora marina TaxID=2490858 RepID=UPI0019D2CC6E|nr:glycerol-3-phosphate 1-O-acyltransferase PlsY [Staphylospora marina]
MFQTWVLPILISYLLGSISFSYLLTRLLKGVDIREHGSGNAGATNTLRVLGKGPGILVFLLDALKGVAAVWVGSALSDGDQVIMLASGIAAVIGHNWPVFLGFRGGKGIATTVGVSAVIAFTATLFAGICAILFIVLTRYVSLGSLILTLCIPAVMWIEGYPNVMVLMMAIVTVMAFMRHKQNIVNLLRGNERKI